MVAAQLPVGSAGLAFAKEHRQVGVDLDQGDGGFEAGMSQKRLGDGGQRFIDGHFA